MRGDEGDCCGSDGSSEVAADEGLLLNSRTNQSLAGGYRDQTDDFSSIGLDCLVCWFFWTLDFGYKFGHSGFSGSGIRFLVRVGSLDRLSFQQAFVSASTDKLD